MESRVYLSAEMHLKLDRKQIEMLDHLCSYGSQLARVVFDTVTGEYPMREVDDLLRQIRIQTAPVVNAIQRAEEKIHGKGGGG